MLPSVRPRYGSEPPLGPYGSSRTESTSTRRALGTLLHTGSPDPVSPTVAPYNFLRSPHALAAVDGLCRRDRSSIHAAFDQQRPGDAGRFIGQGHGHQHLRFARQHSRQPRSFRPAALTSPAHDRARPGGSADAEWFVRPASTRRRAFAFRRWIFATASAQAKRRNLSLSGSPPALARAP